MRWPSRSRTDVRGVVDRYEIYDHILENLRVKMRGAGSPCTYFHNATRTSTGTLATNLTRCYCYGAQETQPDRTHFLCLGTGYLEGYQKYGFQEYVLGTPSPNLTKDSIVIITGDRNSTFTFSSPTALNARIESPDIPLTRFRGFDRFLTTDATDPTQNRVRYYYSLDSGITWTEITMSDYTETKLATRQGNISLPDNATKIKFRILLERRYTTSLAPKFNSIRFRYKNQISLKNIDPRYPFPYPAFLAAREQQDVYVEGGDKGWETKRQFRWWTLPEVRIMNSDIIQFLTGSLQGQYYEIQDLMPHVHGPNTRLLHTSFYSEFIRDSNDVLKILNLLT